MVRVKQNRSMGALSRRFERDRDFGYGTFMTGPARTPMDTDNSELALHFGVYQQERPPRRIFQMGRMAIMHGQAIEKWLSLSDMECSGVAVWKIAVVWTAKPAILLGPNRARPAQRNSHETETPCRKN